MTQRHTAYLALLVNTVIWGAALPIVKPALEYVTPYQYLFYRYALAVPFTIPFLIFVLYKYKPSLKTIVTILSMEFLAITAALSFLYEGLKHTTSIEAGLIANAAPVFITLGGIVFLKEKEELHELIGLVFAIIGVTILTVEPLLEDFASLQSISLSGNLIIMGHNFFWATYVILAKRLYQHIPKALISLVSLWVGLLSFGLLMIITEPSLANTSRLWSDLTTNTQVFWAASYMGILGSIIAVPAIIIGNNLIEASEASLFAYLQPLVYIPLAVLWLKEPLTPIMIAGILVSSLGVLIAERRINHRMIHNGTSHSKKT